MILRIISIPFITLFLFFSIGNDLYAQNFQNGELDGTVGVSSIPTNWQNVPFGDAVCQATGSSQSTPDVMDGSGPTTGILGVPYSGATCVSGLIHQSSSMIWHEGIKQTVSGFVIGNTYSISFFQAVVKQSNALDNTGGWAVYMDNTLVGISASSTSALVYNDPNLIWSRRVITFNATATSHVVKFMPSDDDGNITSGSLTGSVRMGIDSIGLQGGIPLAISDFFEAHYNNSFVKLSWKQFNDMKYDSYFIERSTNGYNFTQIAKIDAVNTSDYIYKDFNPIKGTSYYRIVKNNEAQGYNYSDILEVYVNGKEIKMYAVDNSMYIKGVEDIANYHITIYNSMGRISIYKQAELRTNISQLSKGMYILNLTSKSGETVLTNRFYKE